MVESVLPAGVPGASGTAGASPAAHGVEDPAKVKDAARQFEALLIGQMMKSMRDSEGGWLGTGDDQAGSSAMEYAQEMFAQSLSANGGLGLANLVVKGLDPATGHPHAAAHPPADQ
jgi:peptidoglycan hydrolase FlgJ